MSMTFYNNKANVALIQMNCGEDPRENLEKVLARIEEAGKQGAHIVSTQELFRSPQHGGRHRRRRQTARHLS
jgi:predicted amidohydrolase